jgi:hypothetical protein
MEDLLELVENDRVDVVFEPREEAFELPIGHAEGGVDVKVGEKIGVRT